jgi:GDP/UDP-N,N'-diacetylbacillosamine 2-epimerase (hydrolysing)
MKKIAVITGSRADYDLLYNILVLIKNSNKTELQLCVTGGHLKKKYGFSFNQIIRDGFVINSKIDILKKSDTPISIIESISLGIKKFSSVFKKSLPDLLLVLGDRYEILSSVIPAAYLKIPIAHISGGERSEGSIDEAVRHSITKFSNYHFVANKFYKNRVLQMGENPQNVFDVGSTGIDNINNINFFKKKEIEKKIKFKFKKKNILLTYHSVTYLNEKQNFTELENILKAISFFSDFGVIITYPNADFYNQTIIKQLIKYSKINKNSKLYKYLGRQLYLSCLKEVDIIIGNSSSGIIEAPFLKVPTINIGIRQNGRAKAYSVIDSHNSVDLIVANIKKSLSSNFKKKVANQKTLYGNGNASKKIFNVIKKKIKKDILIKKFYDIKFNEKKYF